MNTRTKMVLFFLALAIAQMAVTPAGYTDDEYSTGTGRVKTQTDENGANSPTTLPTVPTLPLPTIPATPVSNGTALYNQYCFGCHGSSKMGQSVSAIQNAINSNKGGMGTLRTLTAAQISAISGSGTTITPSPVKTYTPAPVPTLGTTPPPAPAPAPAQKWALYNQYCAGCHGTSKQGASAATIQSAINSYSQMGPLKTLTPAQISSLAAGQ